MRIIGGSAAGKQLRVPEGFDVRPMPDKVKLAVFNSLGDRVLDADVLDLFSGTGALGLEMASRGARQLLSVERSARHARFFSRNLKEVGLDDGRIQLQVLDVFTVLPRLSVAGRRFDIVIADPPYGEKNVGRRSQSLAQRLLDAPELPGLLKPDGLLILGHTRRDTLDIPAAWEDWKTLKHGDTSIRFFRVQSAGKSAVEELSENKLPDSITP